MVVPTNAIVPRTFVLKPGMSLFLGALGRIDYLQVKITDFMRLFAHTHTHTHTHRYM